MVRTVASKKFNYTIKGEDKEIRVKFQKAENAKEIHKPSIYWYYAGQRNIFTPPSQSF